MIVVSECPLRVVSLGWRLSTGEPALTVVCKATYLLQPGQSPLAPQQDAPNEDDNHWDDDPGRSLWATSDLAPFKARPEVVLVGHAFASQKQAVRSLFARLVVGTVDKVIEVYADRAWLSHGEMREGPRFLKMRLAYERAAASATNPVGVSFDAPPDGQGARAVPNLQPAGLLMSGPADRFAPIGFGPFAATWSGRRERLGRNAATWSPADWHTRPLPTDFDPAYFNVAPVDQQLDELRPDERIVLEGLHPEHARLVTCLPGVRPRAMLERPGRPAEEMRLRADTLWIDTDREVCTMVWRGAVPLGHAAEAGRVVVTAEVGGVAIGQGGVAEVRPDDGTSTVFGVPAVSQGPALPFSRGGDAGQAAPRAPVADGALPFGGSGGQWLAAPLPAPPAADGEAAVTMFLSPAGTAPPPEVAPRPPAQVPVMVAPLPVYVPPDRQSIGQRFLSEPGLAPEKVVGEPAPLAEPAGDNAPTAERAGEIVELLWFEPKTPARVRTRWPAIIMELAFEPLDPWHDLPSDNPEDARDRHDVFGVLTDGAAIDGSGIDRAVREAVSDKGRFTPPLVLVSGEIRFPFDEVETLKAVVAVVSPMAANDKRLKEWLDAAGELLATPYLQSSTGVVDKLTREIKEQATQGLKGLPQGHLDAYVERILLEQRKYQVRKMFGEECIRALLGAGMPRESAVPVYLPKRLESALPMVPRMGVRMIAEAHMKQDHYEGSGYALRVMALGKVIRMERI